MRTNERCKSFAVERMYSSYSSHCSRFTLVESCSSPWVRSLCQSDDLEQIKIHFPPSTIKPLFLGHPVCSLVGRSNKRYLVSAFRFFKPIFFTSSPLPTFLSTLELHKFSVKYGCRMISWLLVCFATVFVIKNYRSLMWHVTTTVSDKYERILRKWVGPF